MNEDLFLDSVSYIAKRTQCPSVRWNVYKTVTILVPIPLRLIDVQYVLCIQTRRGEVMHTLPQHTQEAHSDQITPSRIRVPFVGRVFLFAQAVTNRWDSAVF